MAALGGIAAAAVCGLANGVLITGLRVIPFIVTLGMMILMRGAAKGLADERRIEAPQTWLNDLLRTLDPDSATHRPGRYLARHRPRAHRRLERSGYTRFGRHLFSIGSNERTARLCGVPVERTKIAVYTAAAALAGVAGVLQFSRLSVGDPTVANGLELDVIAAVIIGGGSLTGGRGSVSGTILGACTMAVIQIGCSQHGLPNWLQEIVTGAIIVLAVALDRWRSRTLMGDHVGSADAGSALPDVANAGGHRRHALRSRLLRRLRHPSHGWRARRPWPDVHYRARERGLRACDRGLPFACRRPELSAITSDFGAFWRVLAEDSQLRWLGPEKGVIHLALAAIVNAVWDLYAQVRTEAAVEAARGHDAAPDRLVHRLPIHHRRTDARGGAGSALEAASAAKSSARISCSGAATPPTRHRSDGSATRTSGFERCATNHWPTAGLISR